MKKIIQLFSLMLIVTNIFAQSKRTVFIEEFTQASCPPCETTTPALNAIIEANITKLVQIRYQTSWPGVDPMNADNPEEVKSRVDYYGVTGVPAVFADGTETASSGVLPQAVINTRYGVSAPVLIEVTHDISSDLSALELTVKITNEGTAAYNLSTDKLRVALIEEAITWPIPPGSTSITVFEAVMKKFFTTTAGVDVPEIAAGETWEYKLTDLELPDVIYDYNQLNIVAFVQDDSDKSVSNCALSEAITLDGYTDLSISSDSQVEGGLCDYAFTPVALVENVSTVMATSFDVALIINSEVIASKNVTAGLAPGDQYVVTFDQINLPAGNSSILFDVSTSAGDIASLNNFTRPIIAGKAGGIEAKIEVGFEETNLGDVPNDIIVDRPFTRLNFIAVNKEGLNVTTPLGGYGKSEQSVIINFWQWNPASTNPSGSMIITDRHDVVAGEMVSFDYAYTSYENSNDRLEVQISKDCGENFTSLFNKSGSTLKTAPELNNGSAYFKPSASQWKSGSVDLNAYVGETVTIRFLVTSSWGDMLYIDNVNIITPSDVNELAVGESVALAPNPANDYSVLTFDLDKSADVSFNVIDLMGRNIMSEKVGNNMNGNFNYTLNTSNLNTGLYLIELNIGGKRVVKRINVSH